MGQVVKWVDDHIIKPATFFFTGNYYGDDGDNFILAASIIPNSDIYAKGGNDTINVAATSVTVWAGTGHDTVNFLAGGVTVNDDSGNLVLNGGSFAATVNKTGHGDLSFHGATGASNIYHKGNGKSTFYGAAISLRLNKVGEGDIYFAGAAGGANVTHKGKGNIKFAGVGGAVTVAKEGDGKIEIHGAAGSTGVTHQGSGNVEFHGAGGHVSITKATGGSISVGGPSFGSGGKQVEFDKKLLTDYKTMKGDLSRIIVGDYNGDGKDDFIRQERGVWDDDHINTANIYLSNGNGTFSKQMLTDYTHMKGDLTNLIIGDYNGDGKDDFIRQEKGVWDNDHINTANVYLSNGNGTFSKHMLTDYTHMKGDLSNIIVGDYNGDGKDDFIRQEKGGWDDDNINTANIYLSNGNGTFSKKTLTDYTSLKGDLTKLIVGDYNGDGKDDFIRQEKGVWDNDDVRTAEIFLSNGNGSFTKKALTDYKSMKGDLSNLIVGDYNGDGKDDFIRQEKGSWDNDSHRTAEMYLSDGDGTFTRYNLNDSLKGDYTNIVVGDYNGDGKDDIIRQEKSDWDNDSSRTAEILISDGKGGFRSSEFDGADRFKGDLTNIIVGDYDGDGRDDIIRQEKGSWDNDDHYTAEILLSRDPLEDLKNPGDNGTQPTVSNHTGDIVFHGLAGNVDINQGADGKVEFKGGAGNVDVDHSGRGDIYFGGAAGKVRLDHRGASGNITVRGASASSTVSKSNQSGSGNIHFTGANAHTRLTHKGHGHVTFQGVGGYSRVDHQGRGNVNFTGAGIANHLTHSGQGNMVFKGAGAANILNHRGDGNIDFKGGGLANVLTHSGNTGNTSFSGAGAANVINHAASGNVSFDGAGLGNVIYHSGDTGDLDVNAAGVANVVIRDGDGEFDANLMAVGNVTVHLGDVDSGASDLMQLGGLNTHTHIGDGNTNLGLAGGLNVATFVGDGNVNSAMIGAGNVLTKVGDGDTYTQATGIGNVITHVNTSSAESDTDAILLGGANILTKAGEGDMNALMAGGGNIATHVGEGDSAIAQLGVGNVITKVGSGNAISAQLGGQNYNVQVGDGQSLALLGGGSNNYVKVGDGLSAAATLGVLNRVMHVGSGDSLALMAGGNNTFTKLELEDEQPDDITAAAMVGLGGNNFRHIGDGKTGALMLSMGNVFTKVGDGATAMAMASGTANVGTHIGDGQTFAAMVGVPVFGKSGNIMTKVGDGTTAALMAANYNVMTHVGSGNTTGVMVGEGNIASKVGQGDQINVALGKANILTHVSTGEVSTELPTNNSYNAALGDLNIMTKVGDGKQVNLMSGKANIATHVGDGEDVNLVLGGKLNVITKVGDGDTATGIIGSKANVLTHVGDGDNTQGVWGEANIITKVGDGTSASALKGSANVVTVVGEGAQAGLLMGHANVVTKVGDGSSVNIMNGSGNLQTKVGDGTTVSLMKGYSNVSVQVGDGDTAFVAYANNNISIKVGDGDYFGFAIAKGKATLINNAKTVGKSLFQTASGYLGSQVISQLIWGAPPSDEEGADNTVDAQTSSSPEQAFEDPDLGIETSALNEDSAASSEQLFSFDEDSLTSRADEDNYAIDAPDASQVETMNSASTSTTLVEGDSDSVQASAPPTQGDDDSLASQATQIVQDGVDSIKTELDALLDEADAILANGGEVSRFLDEAIQKLMDQLGILDDYLAQGEELLFGEQNYASSQAQADFAKTIASQVNADVSDRMIEVNQALADSGDKVDELELQVAQTQSDLAKREQEAQQGQAEAIEAQQQAQQDTAETTQQALEAEQQAQVQANEAGALREQANSNAQGLSKENTSDVNNPYRVAHQGSATQGNTEPHHIDNTFGSDHVETEETLSDAQQALINQGVSTQDITPDYAFTANSQATDSSTNAPEEAPTEQEAQEEEEEAGLTEEQIAALHAAEVANNNLGLRRRWLSDIGADVGVKTESFNDTQFRGQFHRAEAYDKNFVSGEGSWQLESSKVEEIRVIVQTEYGDLDFSDLLKVNDISLKEAINEKVTELTGRQPGSIPEAERKAIRNEIVEKAIAVLEAQRKVSDHLPVVSEFSDGEDSIKSGVFNVQTLGLKGRGEAEIAAIANTILESGADIMTMLEVMGPGDPYMDLRAKLMLYSTATESIASSELISMAGEKLDIRFDAKTMTTADYQTEIRSVLIKQILQNKFPNLGDEDISEIITKADRCKDDPSRSNIKKLTNTKAGEYLAYDVGVQDISLLRFYHNDFQPLDNSSRHQLAADAEFAKSFLSLIDSKKESLSSQDIRDFLTNNEISNADLKNVIEKYGDRFDKNVGIDKKNPGIDQLQKIKAALGDSWEIAYPHDSNGPKYVGQGFGGQETVAFLYNKDKVEINGKPHRVRNPGVFNNTKLTHADGTPITREPVTAQFMLKDSEGDATQKTVDIVGFHPKSPSDNQRNVADWQALKTYFVTQSGKQFLISSDTNIKGTSVTDFEVRGIRITDVISFEQKVQIVKDLGVVNIDISDIDDLFSIPSMNDGDDTRIFNSTIEENLARLKDDLLNKESTFVEYDIAHSDTMLEYGYDEQRSEFTLENLQLDLEKAGNAEDVAFIEEKIKVIQEYHEARSKLKLAKESARASLVNLFFEGQMSADRVNSAFGSLFDETKVNDLVSKSDGIVREVESALNRETIHSSLGTVNKYRDLLDQGFKNIGFAADGEELDRSKRHYNHKVISGTNETLLTLRDPRYSLHQAEGDFVVYKYKVDGKETYRVVNTADDYSMYMTKPPQLIDGKLNLQGMTAKVFAHGSPTGETYTADDNAPRQSHYAPEGMNLESNPAALLDGPGSDVEQNSSGERENLGLGKTRDQFLSNGYSVKNLDETMHATMRHMSDNEVVVTPGKYSDIDTKTLDKHFAQYGIADSQLHVCRGQSNADVYKHQLSRHAAGIAPSIVNDTRRNIVAGANKLPHPSDRLNNRSDNFAGRVNESVNPYYDDRFGQFIDNKIQAIHDRANVIGSSIARKASLLKPKLPMPKSISTLGISTNGNIQLQVGNGEYNAAFVGNTNLGIKIGDGGLRTVYFGNNNALIHIGDATGAKHTVDIAGYRAFDSAQMFMGERNVSYNHGDSNDFIVMLDKSFPLAPFQSPFNGPSDVVGYLKNDIANFDLSGFESDDGAEQPLITRDELAANYYDAQNFLWSSDNAKSIIQQISALDMNSAVEYETLFDYGSENDRSDRALKADAERKANAMFNQALAGQSPLSSAQNRKLSEQNFNITIAGQGEDIILTNGDNQFMFGDNVQSIMDTTIASLFGVLSQDPGKNGQVSNPMAFSGGKSINDAFLNTIRNLARDTFSRVMARTAAGLPDMSFGEAFGMDYTASGDVMVTDEDVNGLANVAEIAGDAMEGMLSALSPFGNNNLGQYLSSSRLVDTLQTKLGGGSEGAGEYRDELIGKPGDNSDQPEDAAPDSGDTSDSSDPEGGETGVGDGEQAGTGGGSEGGIPQMKSSEVFGFGALKLPSIFDFDISGGFSSIPDLVNDMAGLIESFEGDIDTMESQMFDFFSESGYMQDDGDLMLSLGNNNFAWGGDGADLAGFMGLNNNFWGGRGDDMYYGLGENNQASGNAGNDTAVLLGINNIFFGGDGHDFGLASGRNGNLSGGAGADTLYALGDTSWLNGGADNDYLVSVGNFNGIDAGDGNDFGVSIGNYSDVELGLGNDVISVFGNQNTIKAGEGDDMLRVIGHQSEFFAGMGNDFIWAEAEARDNLQINAEGGDDILVLGGEGNIFMGGEGQDTFILGDNILSASISGIESHDRLVFSDIGFDQIWFEQSANDLMVYLDNTTKSVVNVEGYFAQEEQAEIVLGTQADESGDVYYEALTQNGLNQLLETMSGYDMSEDQESFLSELQQDDQQKVASAWSDTVIKNGNVFGNLA